MFRKFKTSKKKRTNYIYYGEGSSKTVLIPGEDGVTEAIIETLHSLDDEEVDNDRRETRRHSNFDDLNDKAEILTDPDSDVEDRIISTLERERAKTIPSNCLGQILRQLPPIGINPAPFAQVHTLVCQFILAITLIQLNFRSYISQAPPRG